MGARISCDVGDNWIAAGEVEEQLEHLEDRFAKKVVTFHEQVARLKRLVRKGWTRRQVPEPESVAGHSLGVGALTLVFARRLGLDTEKALAAAVLHDLCEALTGDITPSDGVAPAEKHARELQAMTEILGPIDGDGELLELWLDCALERSPEGRLVRQLDRLEMLLQASLYECEHGMDLEEFHLSAMEKIDMPVLLEVASAVARGPGGTR